MKIIILKNKLIEALNLVEHSTGNNPNLPVLKNVFINTKDNKVVMSTTNLEIAVTYSFSGKVIENGETTVPCNLLSSIIKNLTSERVTLELKGKKLNITTDNYNASIQTRATKEFPIIPKISNKTPLLETTTKNFLEALNSVISATQFSEIRPEISGVFLNQNNSNLFIVATDSFRLAEKRIDDIEKKSKDQLGVIIPIKTTEEVLRILNSKEDSDLKILFDQTQVLFKTNDLEIISRLIDGTFPDYKSIIPKEVKNEVVLNRLEFIQALKLVGTFSSRINDVKLSIGDGKKHLELSSSNDTLGENLYKIPTKLKGDRFEIIFNWKFLLDGLKAIKDESIIFGVNSSDKPVVLRGVNDKSLFYVIMPLRV